MNGMEIREILELLPHRYPLLLVDRVLDVQPGSHIVAVKNVTINEPFFAGHFPGHPIMPGVMIIEAMAQASAVLAFKTGERLAGKSAVVYFLGIDRARFKRPVGPGDQLMLHARIERRVRGIWKFVAEARVGDALAAEAAMMCTLRDI